MYFYLKDKNKQITAIRLEYYCKADKRIFKFSTGQSINPEDWDNDNKMPFNKKGRADLRATKLNLEKYIVALENAIKDAAIQNKAVTTTYLKQYFTKEFRSVKTNSESVEYLIDKFVESKKKTGKASKTFLDKNKILKDMLLAFRPYLKLNEVNDTTFEDYTYWIRKNYDWTNNTLSRHIRYFKTFLNWCRKNYGYTENITFSVPKYESDQIALNEDEIKLLEDYKGETRLEKVRDLALIGIYSGQRFIDYSKFEKADVIGDMLIKKADKTAHDSFIPLHAKLRAIIDKYDWKLPKISNQKFNKYFKELCKDAGIDREFKKIVYKGKTKEVQYFKAHEVVGSHTCRRTYITLASQKGVPDEAIMKVTGIRDVKTLYKYKKVTLSSVMDATKDLF